MTFSIYQNPTTPTEFLTVLRETARVNLMLSMDLNNPLGETIFNCQLFDEYDGEGERFKPEYGQRLRWVADDGTGTVLFDGFIQNPESEQLGFNEINAEILNYSVYAKDPSWLWEKKLCQAGTFKNFNPGTLIYTLANACDSRFMQAVDNDSGHSVGDLELPLCTYKEAIEEIAKTAGLMVWVDQNWYVHCKKWSTIIGLAQDSKFHITDSNTIYSNLKLNTDGEKLCTRIHVVGSSMDAGTLNPQNRKKGQQKSENLIVTRTASLEHINVIRQKIGYEALPGGTDVNTLPSTTPGIFEDKLECQDVYDETTLQVIGDAYLSMYSVTLLKGSVNYTDSGLVPGRCIHINSNNRNEEAYLPVIELEITTQGGGFDENSNKVYQYTAHVNGPSEITKFARDLEPARSKVLKPKLLIKPKPMTFISHNTTEQVETLNVSGTVYRCNYTY